MLQSYFDCGMNEPATFELFVRKLPAQRNFLMAAGLELVLDYLCDLRFTDVRLEMLARTGRFSGAFLRSLGSLRFTGSVYAMAEGTVFFPDEPILRITAPLREAQLVESRVMNLVHYSTLVASKAARCVLAAPGKQLVDFGLRRAHGAEAGILSARASYLAGFSGTATLQAGLDFHIPMFGTMAHSFVQAHGDESEAFEHFVRSQPENAHLLIDTYDTEIAAKKVVALSKRLAAEKMTIKGVRIDSGDLSIHAQKVRRILDEGGLDAVTILVSGNLDEWRIEKLVHAQAPIDGFGIGTRMNTSADAPYLDCAYKLTQYAGRPRRKRSEGKATLPGVKQVFRTHGAEGKLAWDALVLEDERHAGVPLLQPVMIDGQRLCDRLTLDVMRQHARRELLSVPERIAALNPSNEPYRVDISERLVDLARELDSMQSAH
ncbi:nicotinate phosphoribosyltransferase [Paraburkholderia caribensis]|nr:nicotinate phosphoribosyltransferase [Paraburkholderia caribensis]ALP66727.1 nicotinate phosphoribosyltransferase [Paraburkholderia caribensis]AUT55985.1 nicotinate phosphoribosyltransferase [Paraburkholderia caribensis]